MKLINKLLFFLFLAIGTFYKADTPIPPPPGPPGGGGGGSGPGAIASPIDMYIYALVLVGFLFIVYFNKAKQKKLV